jgi:hypothetical protein
MKFQKNSENSRILLFSVSLSNHALYFVASLICMSAINVGKINVNIMYIRHSGLKKANTTYQIGSALCVAACSMLAANNNLEDQF